MPAVAFECGRTFNAPSFLSRTTLQLPSLCSPNQPRPLATLKGQRRGKPVYSEEAPLAVKPLPPDAPPTGQQLQVERHHRFQTLGAMEINCMTI